MADCAVTEPFGVSAYNQTPRRILLCLSHLRWSFVWQRPQHLMTRFARDFEVLFVEEPEHSPEANEPSIRFDSQDGVTILTPILADGCFQPGFNGEVNPLIRDLLNEFIAGYAPKRATREAVVWYWTPMAWGACPQMLDGALIVYDVMDELANFRFAPVTLLEQENALLHSADLVFTGGPSLYESRKHRHPVTYCFPSGVDVNHFSQAVGMRPAADLPVEIDRPIVGFYGVLDERLDLELLAGIAIRRPTWNIVLIGPLAKISELDLPQHDTVWYLGKRDYAELPSYLAGFDAAILPFALNAATQFISPTKTLEYLAAGKPVVSTPVRDVVDLYGSVVAIANGANHFVKAIEMLWNEPAGLRAERQQRALALLAQASWETITGRMTDLIVSHLEIRP